MFTARPQNKCDDCGDTWYPRGRNRSNRCPACGGSRVRVLSSSLPALLLLLILVAIGGTVAIFMFADHKQVVIPTSPPVAPSLPTVVEKPPEFLPSAPVDEGQQPILESKGKVNTTDSGDTSTAVSKPKLIPKRFAPKSETSDSEEWYSLAKNYQAAGRSDLAIDYLKKVIASNDPKWSPQARELLQKIEPSLGR